MDPPLLPPPSPIPPIELFISRAKTISKSLLYLTTALNTIYSCHQGVTHFLTILRGHPESLLAEVGVMAAHAYIVLSLAMWLHEVFWRAPHSYVGVDRMILLLFTVSMFGLLLEYKMDDKLAVKEVAIKSIEHSAVLLLLHLLAHILFYYQWRMLSQNDDIEMDQF